jgi:tRNA-methyltransferase O
MLIAQTQQGHLVFAEGRNFEHALEDLDGFDYCWVISYMHLNQGWNPKVKPPRGPRVKRGEFTCTLILYPMTALQCAYDHSSAQLLTRAELM